MEIHREGKWCDECCQYRQPDTVVDVEWVVEIDGEKKPPITLNLCDSCVRYKMRSQIPVMCDEIGRRKWAKLAPKGS